MSHRIYTLQRIQTWDEAWCLRFNRASINPAVRNVFPPDQPAGRRHLLVLPDAVAAGGIPGGRAAAGDAHGCRRTGLHGAVQMAEAQDASPAPIQPESGHPSAASHRWTSSASLPATRCTRWPSASWRWPTTRRWPGCCCRSPRWLRVSRLVLGLHYPSDVLAGIAIGATVSGLSLGI